MSERVGERVCFYGLVNKVCDIPEVNLRIRRRRIFVFLLAMLVLHSCASIYSVVDFEVLEPATVSFPDRVAQLIVLNRAPVSLDVLNEINKEEISRELLVIIDTTISHNTFRGLLSVLKQSPIERFHTPFWVSERSADTASRQDMILTKREVADICRRYGADAIISLEFYTMDVDLKSIYYTDAPDVVETRYYEFSNKLTWNIYLPENPRPFDTYSMVDTLYFTEVQDGQFVSRPTAIEMISQLFYESGMKYGRYLVPVWTSTSRILYKGKEDSLQMASKYTSEGDWDRALAIWEGLVSSVDSTTASKALNNIAIYYELEDRLDTASLLLDRALELDSLEVIRMYKEELDTRIQNRQEILKQVF